MAPGRSSRTAPPQRPVSSFIPQILPEPLLCARQWPGHCGHREYAAQNKTTDSLLPSESQQACVEGH